MIYHVMVKQHIDPFKLGISERRFFVERPSRTEAMEAILSICNADYEDVTIEEIYNSAKGIVELEGVHYIEEPRIYRRPTTTNN